MQTPIPKIPAGQRIEVWLNTSDTLTLAAKSEDCWTVTVNNLKHGKHISKQFEISASTLEYIARYVLKVTHA